HISAAIQEQNIRIPGGSVGGAPQKSSQSFEYSIVLDGDLKTEEEFEEIVVKTNPDGTMVFLKDIARVELGEFAYSVSSKINGQVSSQMGIMQTPGGNAVETADGIYKTLEELKKSFPADMDYVVGFENVSIINASISSVLTTLFEAILLVTLVVFIFLQSW